MFPGQFFLYSIELLLFAFQGQLLPQSLHQDAVHCLLRDQEHMLLGPGNDDQDRGLFLQFPFYPLILRFKYAIHLALW